MLNDDLKSIHVRKRKILRLKKLEGKSAKGFNLKIKKNKISSH